MSRELKFRVWDDVHKSLVPRFFYSEKEGLGNFWLWVGNHHIHKNVQQFTGVKDKNGKDIYEGDIVINRNNYEEYCSPAVIIQDEYEYAGWSLAFKPTRPQPDSSDCLRRIVEGVELFQEFQMFLDGRGYEVIGNIFENLELIKYQVE